MKKIFLVQEAFTSDYKKAVKEMTAKNWQMPTAASAWVLHAVDTKEEAIKDCRRYNREDSFTRTFYTEINYFNRDY